MKNNSDSSSIYAIAFDFDGVLAESIEVKTRVFYKDILQRSLSEKRFQELFLRFSRLVVDEVVAAPWVEEAREFLVQNEKRFKYFIVSGMPEDELNEIAQRRERDHFFDAVRGSPKDKVTLLGEIMEGYNLRPEKMVFVGDAETDWYAAQKLNIPFLWRCVPGQIPALPGYNGPRLPSLRNLDRNLQESISL